MLTPLGVLGEELAHEGNSLLSSANCSSMNSITASLTSSSLVRSVAVPTAIDTSSDGTSVISMMPDPFSSCLSGSVTDVSVSVSARGDARAVEGLTSSVAVALSSGSRFDWLIFVPTLGVS